VDVKGKACTPVNGLHLGGGGGGASSTATKRSVRHGNTYYYFGGLYNRTMRHACKQRHTHRHQELDDVSLTAPARRM
jgi:hypothetical protein